jgi:uncharacterized RDD family membrane protein YckC
VSADPGPRDERRRYVGLATRAIAFALDAAVINAVALAVTAGTALILSLLHLPKSVREVFVAVGGVVYVLWSIGYFVGFWSATGQTPGARLMRFRVIPARGDKLNPRRAVVRFVGLILAAIPLLAGYWVILFDRRRRGLQDYLARTVVVEAPAPSANELRRLRRQEMRARGDEIPVD